MHILLFILTIPLCVVVIRYTGHFDCYSTAIYQKKTSTQAEVLGS